MKILEKAPQAMDLQLQLNKVSQAPLLIGKAPTKLKRRRLLTKPPVKLLVLYGVFPVKLILASAHSSTQSTTRALESLVQIQETNCLMTLLR
jgi:hypothetical protein